MGVCELVGYSQQARRWPVPALAMMVPRREAVCCFGGFLLRVTFNVLFSGGFPLVSLRFRLIYSSFQGIDFDQRIWLLLLVITNLDFFLSICLRTLTNTHTHTYGGAVFTQFTHAHTHGHGRSAALPYDDGSKLWQNPDDIIILQHLSRP